MLLYKTNFGFAEIFRYDRSEIMQVKFKIAQSGHTDQQFVDI